jgi:hypothetical protein
MTPGPWSPLPSPKLLKEATDAAARKARIDATGNLAAARVWLFHGTRDRTVYAAVVQGLREYYALYRVKAELVDNKPAGHAMATEDAGNEECAASREPYINDCDYDAAGELLQHLLGKLSPPSAAAAGRLVAFDQREFGGTHGISMAETGFAYIPGACARERCRVHVAFHGCRQGADAVDERFVRQAGYNRWADGNRLIVLYPQAVARYAWWTFNPRGCWDWWGYTGSEYATKEGSQLRAVLGMVERLGLPSKEK